MTTYRIVISFDLNVDVTALAVDALASQVPNLQSGVPDFASQTGSSAGALRVLQSSVRASGSKALNASA